MEGTRPRPSSTSLVLAVALVAAGVLIAVVGGLRDGSVVGGAVAAAGAIPAGRAAWLGMQEPTQGRLVAALGVLLAALAVGGLLLLLRVVDWLR